MSTETKHTKETYLVTLFTRFPENKEKYNYDKSVFVNVKTNIDIFCNGCGEAFSQAPRNHLQGAGCAKCALEKNAKARTKTHDQFVHEAGEVHSNAYNYLSRYVKTRIKMQMQHKSCGNIFTQKPSEHLQGAGCPKCGLEKMAKARTKTHDQFVEEANKVHKNAYNYLSRYVSIHTKIEMQHKSCGNIFTQKPSKHLQGSGCLKCALEKAIQGGRHGAKIRNENAKIISDAESGFYINSAIWNSYKKSAKVRNLNFDMTPKDILELYKKQNGLCVLTGARLICNLTFAAKNSWSIDRVDNNKGYTKDNIMLVSKTVNVFRNRSTLKEFLEICNMVVSNKNAIEKYTAMSPEEKAERLENHSIRFSKKKD